VRPRRARLIVAVGAAAMLAACGGGGGRLSAADYRRQASRICADADRRAKAIPRPRNLSGLRGYLDRTLTIVQQDNDRLRALKPPDDLQDRAAAALRAQGAAIRMLRRLRDELRAPKPSLRAVQAGLAEVSQLGNEADRRFRELGVPRCAS
jgi:hypothetical protein